MRHYKSKHDFFFLYFQFKTMHHFTMYKKMCLLNVITPTECKRIIFARIQWIVAFIACQNLSYTKTMRHGDYKSKHIFCVFQFKTMQHFTINKNQGVFVKHYGMPPAGTKSIKLFLASRSKSR